MGFISSSWRRLLFAGSLRFDPLPAVLINKKYFQSVPAKEKFCSLKMLDQKIDTEQRRLFVNSQVMNRRNIFGL